MRRWIKWTVGTVAAAVVLAAAAAAVGYQLGLRKMARTVPVAVKAVPYATDAQSLERGKYLFESRGCAECHGANGAGRQFVNDGKGVRLAGPTSRRAASLRATSPRTGCVPSVMASSRPDSP